MTQLNERIYWKEVSIGVMSLLTVLSIILAIVSRLEFITTAIPIMTIFRHIAFIVLPVFFFGAVTSIQALNSFGFIGEKLFDSEKSDKTGHK